MVWATLFDDSALINQPQIQNGICCSLANYLLTRGPTNLYSSPCGQGVGG
jgi:hypothetical protein